MEEIQVTPQTTASKPSFILPPHSNRMALSIICTLLCCLIGGIIAIIILAAIGVLADLY